MTFSDGALPDSGDRDPSRRRPLDAATRTLRCRTIAKRGFRQEHYIRDLPPIESPPGNENDILNEETTPHPSEMLLAVLGSCLVIGIHANAVARAIPITKLDLVLSAEVNFGALWGTGDLQLTPIGIEDIVIEAHIESDAPRKVLQALMDHVLLWSPVANSLHNPINLTATVAET